MPARTSKRTTGLGVEGDKDQENCQWRPVPCLSLEVTSWVGLRHHPWSCGARFEPSTLRDTSSCCLVMRGFPGCSGRRSRGSRWRTRTS